MKALWLCLAVIVAALLYSASANSQTMRCSTRADLIKQLGTQYKEKQVAVGVNANGSLTEVLTSKDGATFTILNTRPDGISCILQTGETWMYQDPTILSVSK